MQTCVSSSRPPFRPSPIRCLSVAESSRLGSLCPPAAALWFYLFHTQWCVHVSPALDAAHPLLPLLWPHVCSPRLCFCFCPARRPIRTVLLGSMCMHSCTMIAFLSLAHLTLWPPLNPLTVVCGGQCISFHFFCYVISNQYTPSHAMVIGTVS